MDMNPSLKSVFASWTNGVAHRGMHDLSRPENSRAAFERSVACNQRFECDLHRTLDGELLICHDSSLERMCGKPGIIEELTLEQIRRDYRFPDGSVPITFEELLEINPGRVGMVLELKTYNGNAEALASLAVERFQRLPNPEECVVISFDDAALRAARNLGMTMPLGYLISTEAIKQAPESLLYEFDFLDVEVHYSMLPRFGKYRKRGGAILCWTVKSKLTYRIGKMRTDGMTWEKVDSAKFPLKLNRFIERTFDPT